ncbi:MAG: type II toxin-antitoxin system VapC family toxin [Rhizomicrobium sp.]|nr:type II toxin-antitoxin system VapC family toxin [Rhizomicrobium sp.]
MYLLDTSVVTGLRRRDRADPNLAAWAASVAPSDLYLSALSLLELEMGVLALENRNPTVAAPLRQWLNAKVLPAFAGRILAVDAAVARRCAALHVPHRRPERSALIAATAIVHGLTVVSRNPSDFDPMGIAVINPWLPET